MALEHRPSEQNLMDRDSGPLERAQPHRQLPPFSSVSRISPVPSQDQLGLREPEARPVRALALDVEPVENSKKYPPCRCPPIGMMLLTIVWRVTFHLPWMILSMLWNLALARGSLAYVFGESHILTSNELLQQGEELMDQNIDLEGRFDTPGRILRDAVAAVLEALSSFVGQLDLSDVDSWACGGAYRLSLLGVCALLVPVFYLLVAQRWAYKPFKCLPLKFRQTAGFTLGNTFLQLFVLVYFYLLNSSIHGWTLEGCTSADTFVSKLVAWGLLGHIVVMLWFSINVCYSADIRINQFLFGYDDNSTFRSRASNVMRLTVGSWTLRTCEDFLGSPEDKFKPVYLQSWKRTCRRDNMRRAGRHFALFWLLVPGGIVPYLVSRTVNAWPAFVSRQQAMQLKPSSFWLRLAINLVLLAHVLSSVGFVMHTPRIRTVGAALIGSLGLWWLADTVAACADCFRPSDGPRVYEPNPVDVELAPPQLSPMHGDGLDDAHLYEGLSHVLAVHSSLQARKALMADDPHFAKPLPGHQDEKEDDFDAQLAHAAAVAKPLQVKEEKKEEKVVEQDEKAGQGAQDSQSAQDSQIGQDADAFGPFYGLHSSPLAMQALQEEDPVRGPHRGAVRDVFSGVSAAALSAVPSRPSSRASSGSAADNESSHSGAVDRPHSRLDSAGDVPHSRPDSAGGDRPHSRPDSAGDDRPHSRPDSAGDDRPHSRPGSAGDRPHSRPVSAGVAHSRPGSVGDVETAMDLPILD